MTRDQLILKRRRKKRMRRVAAAAALAAAGFVLYSAHGLIELRRGSGGGEETESVMTEVEGIISVASEPEVTETPEPTATPTPAVPEWRTTADGIFYYLADGSMATGLMEIEGDLYYFGYDGVMLTGWQTDDGNQYYFSPEDGKAVRGEQTIDGKIYWFDEDGINDPSKTVDPTQGKAGMVALTYDDGPGYYTNDLLDLLESYDAKATFFMIGEEVGKYPSAVLREYELGMEQGNHSWDHRTLTHLSGDEIRDEFQKTNDAIESITGGRVELFRAPGGGINDDVFANSLGMYSILWTIDTLDWETKNAQQTYETVINNVSDGDIILMHEIYEASYEASKEIIPKLQEMGFKLVTVSEMAAAKGVELETGQSYGAF